MVLLFLLLLDNLAAMVGACETGANDVGAIVVGAIVGDDVGDLEEVGDWVGEDVGEAVGYLNFETSSHKS